MWTTRMDWDGTNWIVYLSRDGEVVATMSLDEWAKLPVNKHLIEDAVEQARV